MSFARLILFMLMWAGIAIAQSPPNNEYLLGRKAEAAGDIAAATANYQTIVSRNSVAAGSG